MLDFLLASLWRFSRLSSQSSFTIILQRLLTVAALGAVFFVSAGVVMYFALRGREVAVPNVVGKPQGEAEKLLEDEGLKMKVRNTAPEDKVPADAPVSEQLPAPGTTVKTGQVVRVSLKLGAPPAGKDKEKDKEKKDKDDKKEGKDAAKH